MPELTKEREAELRNPDSDLCDKYDACDIADELFREIDRLRQRIAELEKQASGPRCQLCGGPHQFDMSVPSPAWNRVIRGAGLPDTLCTSCIVKAFAMAKVSFIASLWGEELNGVAVEFRVNGAEANLLIETEQRLLDQIADRDKRIAELEAMLTRQKDGGQGPGQSDRDCAMRIWELDAVVEMKNPRGPGSGIEDVASVIAARVAEAEKPWRDAMRTIEDKTHVGPDWEDVDLSDTCESVNDIARALLSKGGGT